MKKNRIFRRAAALLLCMLAVFAAFPAARADSSQPMPDNEGARVVYVYNLDHGVRIGGKGTEERFFPSSTVKIMTGLVAVSALSSRLDETVIVRKEMLREFTSNILGLREGDEFTVRDLLYLSLCGCYHDAIAVLEYVVAGSEKAFVAKMNELAAELGMENTHFTNSTGISDDGMYSTGEDIARLAVAASRNTLFMTVTSAAEYNPEGLKNYSDPSFYNRNLLVGKGRSKDYFNPVCRGMSAGQNAADEYNVVTVAQKDGSSYLIMVLGAGKDETGRLIAYDLTNQLISWVFSAYGTVRLLSASEIAGELPVEMGQDADSVLIVPEEDVSAYGPLSLAGDMGRVRVTTKFTVSSLQAPVTAGTRVGTITVFIDGEEYRTVPLVTKTGVARSRLMYFFSRITAFAHSRFFIASVVSAVIYTVIALCIRSSLRGKEKKKSRYLK